MLELPPHGLPLLLCGPILRRVDKASVSVFVVLKDKWNVVLTLYKYKFAGNKFQQIAQTENPVSPKTLGLRFHPLVITLEVSELLEEEVIYGYNLTFSNPKNPNEKKDLKSLNLLGGSIDFSGEKNKENPTIIPFPSLSYATDAYPTFTLPPKDLQKLRLVHGSCRLPHNDRPDALPALDEILDLEWEVSQGSFRKTWELHGRRPHKLFLTGDQIYADDVAPSMLYLARRVGLYLLGWDKPIPGHEDIPVPKLAFHLLPNRRQYTMANVAKFTSGHQDSHLIYFYEYIGMYVMVWSDVFWRQQSMSEKLIKIMADEVFESRSHPWGVEELVKAKEVFQTTHKTILRFAQSLSYVRRALANTPTYMIFDDHEVTDDWNLNWNWSVNVNNSSMGKRIVQNALSAYTVFQAWGNNPKEFLSTWVGGGRVLERLEVEWDKPDQGNDLQTQLERVKWDWDYKDESLDYQFIALDTRTKRYFESQGSGALPPGLITLDELKRQITDRLDKPKVFSATFIISPPPIFGSTFADGWVKIGIIQPVKSFLEIIEELGISKDESKISQMLDNEAWDFHPYFHEELLRVLAPFRRVIILSGDVHYGYTASIDYWDQRGDPDLGITAKFIQCTSSGLKKEDTLTRAFGIDTHDAREQSLKMIPGTFTGAVIPGLRLFEVKSLSIAGLLYLLPKLEHPDVAYCGWDNPGWHIKINGVSEYVGSEKKSQGAWSPLPALYPVPRGPDYTFATRPSWRYRIKFIWDGHGVVEPKSENYKGKGLDGMRNQAGDHRFLVTHNSMRRIVGNNNIALISFNESSPQNPQVDKTNLYLQQDFWFRLESVDLTTLLPHPIGPNARLELKALDSMALPYTRHTAPADTAIDPPDEDSPQPSLTTY